MSDHQPVTIVLPDTFTSWFDTPRGPTAALRTAWEGRETTSNDYGTWHHLTLSLPPKSLVTSLDRLAGVAEALAELALEARTKASADYQRARYQDADRDLQAARNARKRIGKIRDETTQQ